LAQSIFVEPNPILRARVTTLNGIIHFLVEEIWDAPLKKSFAILDASFLSSRFDSPLHEMIDHAELTELDTQTFARTRGTLIPSELAGMTFWWMKQSALGSGRIRFEGRIQNITIGV
jgi:hypothetical protein